MTGTRPISILIAALGGEGGGVLSNWIVAAATSAGLPAQSTSIPGVAQRTGATTYYIEIFPTPSRDLGGRKPVLALTPGVGDIDIAVASELVEAGRTIAAGFVTRERTLMIASTGRVYTVAEKAAMADGRYDPDRIIKTIGATAQRGLLFDMEQMAKDCGAMINAVMLGAIAASGRLPITADIFEAAIRSDGKAVDSNLRGFRAGVVASKHSGLSNSGQPKSKRARKAVAALAALETEIAATTPEPFVIEGARRLAAFQDSDYARLYLNRLRPIQELDARVGGDGKLLRETARHLAVRMSFEDVIRVAEAKIDPERFRRIKHEVGAKPGEPFQIFDFLKPGIEEFAQLLPPSWARRVLSLAERHHRLGRLHWGMEINSVSIGGFLRFWTLAKLKAWRRHSYRYQQEQAAIEGWLAYIKEAGERSPDLAMEVIELARLIKGYGDTLKRGMSNFRAIETRVIRPILSGQIHAQRGVDAIASARTAALVDPDGEALERCLTEFEKRAALPVAAE